MTDAPEVRDNTDADRFELEADGHTGFLAYRRADGRLSLDHTEVPEELGGRGVGGKLVQAAVDAAVEEGLTIVPRCEFARSWLERHPDEAGKATIAW